MDPTNEQGAVPASLQAVAQRLRDPRLAQLVASYGEYHVSVRRVVLLALLIAWCFYWERLAGPSHSKQVLGAEAALLRPWVELFFTGALGWAVAVRGRLVPTTELIDGVGALVNMLGIGVILSLAWTLSVPVITLLPLATIMTGARFGRRAFFASMLGSVLLLVLAAPPHYWGQRPAFLAFALVLLIGLPLTVSRLLDTIVSVSQAALRSRDAQSRFLATMSHELRTPLHTVVHASSLIDTSALGAAERRLMQSLRANANALLQRVNDVLDVAAIDAGRLHFTREPFLAANVLDQVRDVVGPLARKKGVQLRAMHGRKLDDALLGDPGRIAQVLINLGSNAVKFTPPGGQVGIELRMSDASQVQPRLVCTVSDTGSGVPDELKTRIFEPFYQASDGPARRHDGTGLGLHIVRSICQQLGGRVTVGDNPGGGSVFIATIPVQRAAPEQAVIEPLDTVLSLDAHRARVPALNCLVVDDNAASRDTLGHLLRRAGHRVRFAATGQEGLEAMATAPRPDIVFLDLHMPDLSGLEVLARQRQRDATLPVVMLSADSDPDAIARASAQGATAYLTKPVAIDRLLALMRTINPSGERAPAPAGPAPATAPAESSLSVICRIATDAQRREYLQKWQDELQQDTGELLAALDRTDHAAASQRLHRLQNAFLVMGRPAALAACNALRQAMRGNQPLPDPLATLQAEIAATQAMLQERLVTPNGAAAVG